MLGSADPGLDFVEIYGDYSFGLTENLSLDIHFGFNKFDDKEAGAAFGIGEVGDPKDQYLDYAIGLSTSALGVDWGLQVIGTDLSDDECFDGFKGCEETIVVSVSKSL